MISSIPRTIDWRKNRNTKPSAWPAAVPIAPITKPVGTNILSMLCRVAPMVRRIAMSRVLARTNMMSEDRMLKTATSTMMDKTRNITTRSTASASNRLELIVFQSEITAVPASLR